MAEPFVSPLSQTTSPFARSFGFGTTPEAQEAERTRFETERLRKIDVGVTQAEQQALSQLRGAVGRLKAEGLPPDQIAGALFKDQSMVDAITTLPPDVLKKVIANVTAPDRPGQLVSPGQELFQPDAKTGDLRSVASVETEAVQTARGLVKLAELPPDKARAAYSAALQASLAGNDTENERLIQTLIRDFGFTQEAAVGIVQFTKVRQFTDPQTKQTNVVIVNSLTRESFQLKDDGTFERVDVFGTDPAGNPTDPDAQFPVGEEGVAPQVQQPAQLPKAVTETETSPGLTAAQATGPVPTISNLISKVFGAFEPAAINQGIVEGRAAITALKRDIVNYGKTVGRISLQSENRILEQSPSESIFTNPQIEIGKMIRLRSQIEDRNALDLAITQDPTIEPTLKQEARKRMQAGNVVMKQLGSMAELKAALDQAKTTQATGQFQLIQDQLNALTSSAAEATTGVREKISAKVAKIKADIIKGVNPDARSLADLSRAELEQIKAFLLERK